MSEEHQQESTEQSSECRGECSTAAAEDVELVDELVGVLAVVVVDGTGVELALVEEELEQERGALVGRVRVGRLCGDAARARRARHDDRLVVRAPVDPAAEVA